MNLAWERLSDGVVIDSGGTLTEAVAIDADVQHRWLLDQL